MGAQRGGALVSPALARHAAARASERSSVLKEQRKYQEEMRLERDGGRGRGGQPKGGGRGDAAPKGAGKGEEGKRVAPWSLDGSLAAWAKSIILGPA